MRLFSWDELLNTWVADRYHLVEVLGEGGFGAVFLADQVVADILIRRVALKLTPTLDNASDAERQIRELMVSAYLDHPNLIRCHDLGSYSLNGVQMLYLVMEVAEESLDQRMARGVLEPNETREIICNVAAGLAHLHSLPESYAHRDVKPSNILRVGDRWKLSDFGLTRGTGGQTGMTSHLQGTPEYAPPEAYEGIISSSGDVWSLGVVMSEMLTGAHPFPFSTPNELMRKVLDSLPVFPSPLPSPFDRLVPACLSKDPHQRVSAAEIIRELSIPESQTNLRFSFPPNCLQSSENTRIVNGLEFVRVPAGEFLYGDKRKTVWLGEFWIKKHPVTVREYRRFCETTNRKMPPPPKWGWIDDHPIVCVTWNDAEAFAKWAECRLPKEMEWEKAARGADGREYPGGRDFDASKCVCSVNIKRASTAPVGSCQAGASPYGCLDMAGNVWEWCEDRDFIACIMRGGSWGSTVKSYFRVAFRGRSFPGHTNNGRGFRVVLQGSV